MEIDVLKNLNNRQDSYPINVDIVDESFYLISFIDAGQLGFDEYNVHTMEHIRSLVKNIAPAGVSGFKAFAVLDIAFVLIGHDLYKWDLIINSVTLIKTDVNWVWKISDTKILMTKYNTEDLEVTDHSGSVLAFQASPAHDSKNYLGEPIFIDDDNWYMATTSGLMRHTINVTDLDEVLEVSFSGLLNAIKVGTDIYGFGYSVANDQGGISLLLLNIDEFDEIDVIFEDTLEVSRICTTQVDDKTIYAMNGTFGSYTNEYTHGVRIDLPYKDRSNVVVSRLLLNTVMFMTLKASTENVVFGLSYIFESQVVGLAGRLITEQKSLSVKKNWWWLWLLIIAVAIFYFTNREKSY